MNHESNLGNGANIVSIGAGTNPHPAIPLSIMPPYRFRPLVGLISSVNCVRQRHWFHFIMELAQPVDIVNIPTAANAAEFLGAPLGRYFHSILLTTTFLAREGRYGWRHRVFEYLRNGGTVIVMADMLQMTCDELDDFFIEAGVSWRVLASSVVTAQTLCAFGVNAPRRLLQETLPPATWHRTAFLHSVMPYEMWYRPSNLNDLRWTAASASLPTEAIDSCLKSTAGVALARVGLGRLGYLEDLDASVTSMAIIYGLCGIRPFPMWRVVGLQSQDVRRVYASGARDQQLVDGVVREDVDEQDLDEGDSDDDSNDGDAWQEDLYSTE